MENTADSDSAAGPPTTGSPYGSGSPEGEREAKEAAAAEGAIDREAVAEETAKAVNRFAEARASVAKAQEQARSQERSALPARERRARRSRGGARARTSYLSQGGGQRWGDWPYPSVPYGDLFEASERVCELARRVREKASSDVVGSALFGVVIEEQAESLAKKLSRPGGPFRKGPAPLYPFSSRAFREALESAELVGRFASRAKGAGSYLDAPDVLGRADPGLDFSSSGGGGGEAEDASFEVAAEEAGRAAFLLASQWQEGREVQEDVEEALGRVEMHVAQFGRSRSFPEKPKRDLGRVFSEARARSRVSYIYAPLQSAFYLSRLKDTEESRRREKGGEGGGPSKSLEERAVAAGLKTTEDPEVRAFLFGPPSSPEGEEARPGPLSSDQRELVEKRLRKSYRAALGVGKKAAQVAREITPVSGRARRLQSEVGAGAGDLRERSVAHGSKTAREKQSGHRREEKTEENPHRKESPHREGGPHGKESSQKESPERGSFRQTGPQM